MAGEEVTGASVGMFQSSSGGPASAMLGFVTRTSGVAPLRASAS
jgi:hypothetical protein